MRILMLNETGQIGGSTDQISILKNGLEKLGHVVRMSGQIDDDCDIIHFNHLNCNWTKRQFEKCNKPFTVKCIWHESIKDWCYFNGNKWIDSVQDARIVYSKVVDIAQQASFLIYESPLEKERILNFLYTRLGEDALKIEKKMIFMLPAVNNAIKNETPLEERKYIHINGRYQPYKQFHKVIQICKELNLPLITAGWAWHKPYYDLCHSYQYGEIMELKSKEELNEIYNKTRVYCCASPREVCNTSVNEAIACGCNIVCTSENLGNSNVKYKDSYHVYEFGNDRDLKEKLLSAYSHPTEQRNHFWDEDQLVSTYLNLFNETMPKIFI